MNSPVSDQVIDTMAGLYEAEGYGPEPAEHRISYQPFRPALNPIQAQCYDGIRTHLFCCLHGARYTGKTFAGIHALIEHCRENRNARALVIVLTGRQGEEGGAWYKLNHFALPEWHRGCGLEYTEPKTNKYKDVFIWISNRHGGWSKVVLLSMPFEGFVADRIKGMEPTFILVDEAQTLQTDTYFTSIVQQLGRDPAIYHQPIVYCCNPAGTTHWLYKRFFVDPYDAETGGVNKDYFVQQVPLSDNRHNIPAQYLRRLIEATKNDETEYRRMVLGEWIDRPEGDALFAGYFDADRHIRGQAARNMGLLPIKGVPIITGWDLGSAHSSIHLQQFVATEKKNLWLTFDVLNHVDVYTPYRSLVPKVMDRMVYWCKRIGFDFRFQHISDNSAFNQYRAREGSFDHLDVEQISQDYAKLMKLDDRFVIRLLEAPKGGGSVEHRVRITREKLQMDELFVSATNSATIDMFTLLPEDPKNRMCPPDRHRHRHPFDSLTYPHHYYQAKQAKPKVEELGPRPEMYVAGSKAR
jgi:hypothetical protein